MHAHGPSCLHGPIKRDREWWSVLAESDRLLIDSPIRRPLVERVRREIAEGAYDTPEKFEAALDHLLRRIEEE